MPVVFTEPSLLDETGTVEDLINEVYTHLEPSSFGYLNRLATAIVDTTETEFVFEYDNRAAIKPGAYLCCGVEVVYVWAFDETTKTATVQRAMLGSVASTHSTGALVQIQPRVSRFDVLKQLRHDIRSWPPALFVADSVVIDGSVAARAYDLPATDMQRILEVRWTSSLSGSVTRNYRGWHIDTNADTDVFPSGTSITFDTAPGTGIFQVVYARPFDTSSFNLYTQLSTIGLTESVREIPVLGAAARLVREAPRTDTRAQGQSRLAEEVPPMHLTNTAKDLMRRRDDRIHQEIARLRESWPQRRG